MRREWGPWIKTRQWGEFERLAKTDPSQPLADTIAELERGFTEKADRRALRKVLFLLAQAGYRPEPVEEAGKDVPSDVPTIQETAFMVSPGGMGVGTFVYGKREGKKLRWLFVDSLPLHGIEGAREAEADNERPEESMQAYLGARIERRVCAKVPADYARARIAGEIKRTKGSLPQILAYWRSEFPAGNEPPHPAEELLRAGDPLSPGEIAERYGLACLWRLELGGAAALLRQFASRADLEDPVEAMIDEGGAALMTPEMVESRAVSLLDLAYLCRLTNRPGSEDFLSLADSLRAEGSQSRYARDTVLLTLFHLRQLYGREKDATEPTP